MSEHIFEASDANFQSEVLEATKAVLVDFWAPWCGPCRMLAPTLEDLAKELKDQLKVVKINVDDHSEKASQYGVRSIPALMVFKNGELVANRQGALSKSELLAWVTPHL